MRAHRDFSILADVETPVTLFHKLSQGEGTAFLLESNEDDSRLARYSFIGIDPEKTIVFRDGIATVTTCRTDARTEISFTDPLAVLRALLDEQVTPELDIPDFPFTGGLVGYLGYGATQYFEHIPQQDADPLGVPDGAYGLYDAILVYDHLYRRIHLVSRRPEHDTKALWDRIRHRLETAKSLPPLRADVDTVADATLFEGVTGPFTHEGFCDTVRAAKQLIYEGQVFQIVVAQRFSLAITASAIDIYRTVRAINPSPYAYHLKFPDFDYLGSSPETFVRCHDGEMTVRVLAGTRPRGATETEDAQLRESLLADVKELAEHRMLVDLGRNDLGRVCQVGTIEIGSMDLVRYTHVMHLATRLTGQLRNDKHAFDAFRSVFPRGTVSGAPKIRAMKLLAELEPERRGVYAGAVGYFDYAGNLDSAIAIRSVLVKDGVAHINAGAGVVFDSDPEAEYQETRNKAKSILKAVRMAQSEAQAQAEAQPV